VGYPADMWRNICNKQGYSCRVRQSKRDNWPGSPVRGPGHRNDKIQALLQVFQYVLSSCKGIKKPPQYKTMGAFEKRHLHNLQDPA